MDYINKGGDKGLWLLTHKAHNEIKRELKDELHG